MSNSKEMLIMGIDPGTVACGWAVGGLDGIPTATGSIVSSTTVDTNLRIFKVADDLAEVASQWRVSFVYCESPMVFVGVKAALALGGLSAVINYTIWKKTGLQVNYLKPTEIRKLLHVPKIDKLKGVKLKKGDIKQNSIAWIRELMDDLQLKYEKVKKGKKVTLGEEDRLEGIGVYWAGCSELSLALKSEKE